MLRSANVPHGYVVCSILFSCIGAISGPRARLYQSAYSTHYAPLCELPPYIFLSDIALLALVEILREKTWSSSAQRASHPLPTRQGFSRCSRSSWMATRHG